MKVPMALMASVILAFVASQASFASNVGSPVYQQDAESIQLDPNWANPVEYEDDTPTGASKVRSSNKRCGPKDKDCAEEE